MSKKLLMNNYSENGFEWDYEKKSENPISIKDLCREYLIESNINLNTFSNNQILEIDLNEVVSFSNDPQIMLLCRKNTGGKVYWDNNGVLKMSNNSSFALKLNYPTKLRLTLIDNIFSLYIDEVLKVSINVYTSNFLSYAGIQLGNRNISATGFRYKNFE